MWKTNNIYYLAIYHVLFIYYFNNVLFKIVNS